LAAAVAIVASAGVAGASFETVDTGTLARSPDAFVGRVVTVAGAVHRQLGPDSFTLDEDASFAGPDVLVLARRLPCAVPTAAAVVVTGIVSRFDDAQVQRDHAWFRRAPELVVRFRSRPVIAAASIRTDDGQELVDADATAAPRREGRVRFQTTTTGGAVSPRDRGAGSARPCIRPGPR
jgi:hypothetical protein